MNLKFEELNKDNFGLAVKIQNTIFDKENGIENYLEILHKDPTMKNPNCWITYAGDKAIGVIGFYTHLNYPKDAWIGWFGVLKEFRHNGYGSNMLDFFEKYSKDNGYENIRLYTDEIDNHDAVRLYSKRGMIYEQYLNLDDQIPSVGNILIFSKSLVSDKPTLWNNKNIELKEQYAKQNYIK